MSTVQLHQKARGLYRVMVVDAATREVVWEQKEWGHNLILNNGMDAIASLTWAQATIYGIAGTGVVPTSVDSANTTASQSGTSVSASVGSYGFSSGDIGNMIKWDSGEEARITGYTSPQAVTVTPSQSVGSGHFVVYQTNQTGLSTEVQRTQTYLPGAPNCQTTINYNSGLVAMRRTFDFAAEGSQRNYTEIGVGWNASLNASNTTFSRIVLLNPVTVNVGQQLRFVYELQVTLSPITPVSFSAVVSGWPVSPSTDTNAVQQLSLHGLALVNNNGQVIQDGDQAAASNEPSTSSSLFLWLSNNSTAVAAFGTPVTRHNSAWDMVGLSLSPYTSLNFYRDKSGTFNVAQMNRTDIRSFGIGYNNVNLSSTTYASDSTGPVVVLDQPEAKSNTQTLTLTFRYSWSRVLS